LWKLSEKGLVSTIYKDKVKVFRALDPNSLLNLLDEKESKLKELKKEVSLILPSLLKKKSNSVEDFAKVYEGYEGMKTLYEEAIRVLELNKEDFIGFTLVDEFQYTQAKDFFKIYDRKRAKAGIYLRLIAEESQKNYLENFKGDNIEYRFIKKSLPLGTIIYGDTVATVIWGEVPKAFAIHFKEHAKKYKSFFEDLWRNSNN